MREFDKEQEQGWKTLGIRNLMKMDERMNLIRMRERRDFDKDKRGDGI